VDSAAAGPESSSPGVTGLPSPSTQPRASAQPDGRGLQAERSLLDAARSAISRGEPSEALAAVQRHEKEYPHGLLSEEREALAIRALVMLHRVDEARTRAARFKQQFPNSLAQAAIDAELANP
jgi:hypothetical protein